VDAFEEHPIGLWGRGGIGDRFEHRPQLGRRHRELDGIGTGLPCGEVFGRQGAQVPLGRTGHELGMTIASGELKLAAFG
jgi:hypothetical protein